MEVDYYDSENVTYATVSNKRTGTISFYDGNAVTNGSNYVEIIKQAAASNLPLEGAEIEIWTDDAGPTDTIAYLKDGTAVTNHTVFTTGKNGTIKLTRLINNAVFNVQEQTPPDKYLLNETTKQFCVDGESYIHEGGTLPTYDSVTSDTSDYTLHFEDEIEAMQGYEIKIWCDDYADSVVIGRWKTVDKDNNTAYINIYNGTVLTTDAAGDIELTDLEAGHTYNYKPYNKSEIKVIEYTVTIKDNVASLATGGQGRYVIYCIGGGLLIALMIIFIIVKNKKKKDDEEEPADRS